MITRSFSVVFLLFVGFQTLALVAFGPDVASNVLRTRGGQRTVEYVERFCRARIRRVDGYALF